MSLRLAGARPWALLMSYSQSKKSNDTGKKLQALKTQLYGKESSATFTQLTTIGGLNHPEIKSNTSRETNQKITAIPSYLKHELIKIAFLAAIAICAQIFVYLKFH